MLSFLLDEHISPEVAAIIARLRSDISAVAIVDWEHGACIGLSEEEILRAAEVEGLTLVTYDQRTIPRLCDVWQIPGSHMPA